MLVDMNPPSLARLPMDGSLWHPSSGPREVRGVVGSLCDPAIRGRQELVAVATEAARVLELDPEGLQEFLDDWRTEEPTIEDLFIGKSETKRIPRGIATCYGGHQFGAWAGQLGDGRAVILGERHGYDVGLKGSGPTPYSRGGDGFATFRGCAREFFGAAYLAALGVPTVRSLALWASDHSIWRASTDGNPEKATQERAGIVARISKGSLALRFGTFELASLRGDTDLLEDLLRYAWTKMDEGRQFSASDLVEEVTIRTAHLVAQWDAVGFVHGVLNTDNFSILGETIDFGPFAFVEQADLDIVPNLSDRSGRYRRSNQVQAAKDAVNKFAACIPSSSRSDVDLLFDATFETASIDLKSQKLALPATQANAQLFDDLLSTSRDRTTLLRNLVDQQPPVVDDDNSWYATRFREYAKRRAHFVREDPLAAARHRHNALTRLNPAFIPRNHAIHDAVETFLATGEPTILQALLTACEEPFNDHSNLLPPVYFHPPDHLRPGISILS